MAQESCVTNLQQLAAEAYDDQHCVYSPGPLPPWRAGPTDGGGPWWIDCSQFDCADLLTAPTNLPSGVTAYPVVLTKDLSTG